MSIDHLHLHIPPVVVAPRGATLAAMLAASLGRALQRLQAAWQPRAWGHSVWFALEASGQRRASRDLLDAARRCEAHDPEHAHLLRQAARFTSRPDAVALEAASVRELALRYLKSDRGFAADLLAAADRHERLHGQTRVG